MVNATGLHGTPLSRSPPLPPRRTCRIPQAVLHSDVLPQSRRAPVSADPLEEATALPLKVWLVLILTNEGPPTTPFFTATLARTISPIPGYQRYLPASFSVNPPACHGSPNHNKPAVYRSRPSSLATPPLTGSLPPTSLQVSSTTQPRTTPTDSVSVASEHRTVPLQPNVRESPSETTTTTPLLSQRSCRFTT